MDQEIRNKTLFTDNLTVYVGSPKESEQTKQNNLRSNQQLQHSCRTQDNIQSQLTSYTASTNKWTLKLKTRYHPC